MDYDALVTEILTRVLAKLNQAEASATPSSCDIPDTSCSSGSTCTSLAAPVAKKEKRITKRVVTERDMRLAFDENVTCVTVGEKTIVTDVAQEYATKNKIEIVRCE